MAYIVGILSPEEEAELRRRGWEVEDAPKVDFDNHGAQAFNNQLKMVWVDSSMFAVMNGPDWDKGDSRTPKNTCAPNTKAGALRSGPHLKPTTS